MLPMLAVPAAPFDSPGYSFEVKWNGIRALAAYRQRIDSSGAESGPSHRLASPQRSRNSSHPLAHRCPPLARISPLCAPLRLAKEILSQSAASHEQEVGRQESFHLEKC